MPTKPVVATPLSTVAKNDRSSSPAQHSEPPPPERLARHFEKKTDDPERPVTTRSTPKTTRRQEGSPFRPLVQPTVTTLPKPVVLPTVAEPISDVHDDQRPFVSVTIGRVSVNAVIERSTPPARSATPPGPSLTLEKYLEQREGRR
ncbi:MAG: hypothetical protein ACR2IF_07265 [Terriglobales bacterium]